MSGEQVGVIVFLGIVVSTVAIVFIYIYFDEIVDFFKKPYRVYKHNKQMNCLHHWRRMDADYSRPEPLYRYRCAKCKSDKKLWKHESKQFEKDFMSDWDEHEE